MDPRVGFPTDASTRTEEWNGFPSTSHYSKLQSSLDVSMSCPTLRPSSSSMTFGLPLRSYRDHAGRVQLFVPLVGEPLVGEPLVGPVQAKRKEDGWSAFQDTSGWLQAARFSKSSIV